MPLRCCSSPNCHRFHLLCRFPDFSRGREITAAPGVGEIGQRAQSGIDHGKARRAQQLIEVGGDGEEDRRRQHGRQVLGGKDGARAAEDVWLFRFRDRQREAFFKQEEILHVHRADEYRQRARRQRDPEKMAEELENIQPRSHKGEIHQAGNQHEYTADEQHALPALLVRQHGEQEQQHEEGAGIERVQPRQHEGERWQRQAGRVDGTEQRQLDGFA